MLFVLVFIGACFSWLGVHLDSFQNTYEQPFLESRGATLKDFAAASSVEDIPWSSKIVYALPLDAGYCLSRVLGVTLGLRRPMIVTGQLIATTCFALILVIDPVANMALYQLAGFVRQLGVVFVAIAIEGYATDASISIFAGREALPGAAFQIGRNLGASIGQLAGGRLSESQGFGAMFALFLAMTASTIPMAFFVHELRPVPAPEAAVSAALQKLVPVRLILAWVVRPPVLAFLSIMCIANTGQIMATVFQVKWWTSTREVSLSEVGQLTFVINIVSLVANAPVAWFIDTFVKTRFQMTATLALTMTAWAAYAVLPLATPEGAAAKTAIYAIQVFGGIVASFVNVLYFAILLRVADKRFSATAFSLFTMITNAFGGPVPKQISVAVLNSTSGGDIPGIVRCTWIGAIVGACAVLACPLLVVPTVEEQLKLDGLEGQAGTSASASADRPEEARAEVAGGGNASLQMNPFAGRRERVVAKLAGAPRPPAPMAAHY
jgi:hypothetical protein